MKYLITVVLLSFFIVAKAQLKSGIEIVQIAIDSFKLPSMSAAVYKNNELVFSYTAGISDINTEKKVSKDAPYHIGSITKSMTATMIAYLVEEGKLKWNTRIIDIFPKLDSLHSNYANATLTQLLSHTSGLVDIITGEDWRIMEHDSVTSPKRQRMELMIRALKNPKNRNRGKDWMYANLNYSIGALMAEEVTGKSWKNLMDTYVAKNAEVDINFGWPKDFGGCIVPKGHVHISDIREDYVVPEGSSKLTDIYEMWGPDGPHKAPITIQPAGDINMRVSDLAKYGYFHIAGLNGENKELSQENFRILHTAIMEGYALGWNILPDGTPGIPNKIQHQHLGSGGTFTALLAIFPEEKISVAVVHNGGSSVPPLGYVLKGLTLLYMSK